jgi:hypothetical protein
MIYVFGNSHANVFTNTRPGNFGLGKKHSKFISYCLGPVIAYNFFEHHHNKILNVIEELKVSKEDWIVLAVGEVDCRWHLPFQAHQQNRNYAEIVDECVDRFFRSHMSLKEKGYNVIGWGGHPSTTSGHNNDNESPIFGDCLYRNTISKYWDKSLEKRCHENDIEYVSILNYFIDENNGLTKMEYYSDYCHLDHEKVETIISNAFERFNV